jgi:iron complex outermembrane recepter protein
MAAARQWIAVVAMVLVLGSVQAQGDVSPGPAPGKVIVNIDSQPLRGALRAFGEQTGIQVLFRSDNLSVDGVITPRVAGELSPEEALDRLLGKTGLKYEFVNRHTVRILRAGAAQGVKDADEPIHPNAVPDPAPRTTGRSATSSQSDKSDLGEITVTARRREENLNTVPVAITALTGAELRSKGVETAADLQNFVPSLSVSSSGPTRDDYIFAIRGMGPTGGSGPGAVLGGGGTGVVAYFAEVPTTAAGPGLFYDLENVQVIEGPQGTLFGKNTTGGAILFVPRKPTNDFEGYVDASAGNYNMKSATVAVNVPLIDDELLVRFSAEGQKRDGFTVDRGPFYPGKDYDNRNFWAGRLSIVFRPIDAVENYTIVSVLDSDEHGDGFVLSAVNPAGPFAAQLLPILAQQQAAGVRSTSLSDDEVDHRYNYGIINTTRWSLSEAVQFKNIFSYQVEKWRNSEDIDGSPLILDDLVTPEGAAWHTQVGTYTEEPQLQGTSLGGNLKWTVGAYYEDGHNIAPQPYEVEVAEGNFIIRQADQTNSERSRGLYGQTTYDLGALSDALEKLKLTTGYRYTWDNYGYGIQSYSPSTGNGCLTSPGTYPASSCLFSSAGSSSGSSWTLGLDYQWTPDSVVYVRSGRGYVPGGFNPSFGFTPGGVLTPQYRFAPESVIDVEVGAKSRFTLWGAPAQVETDVFRSDYKDIQRLVSETLPGGIESNFTTNASAAVIEGFEFQGSVLPVRSLKLNASCSYNHGKYTEINPAAAPSLIGIPFAYLPASKASVGATYTLPFDAASGGVDVSAVYSYQSRFFDAPAVQPMDYISGYGLLNLRLEWNDILRSSVDAALFVTNAANKVYRVGQYSSYVSDGYITSFYGEPRMFGGELRYRFGAGK